MKKNIFCKVGLLYLFLLCFSGIHAQDELIYEDKVYIDNIKSVQFKGVSSQTSNFPVIQLNRGKLYFSFDEIGTELYRYRYKVIHCDRNWNPTDIDRFEYIDGIDYQEIENYQFSNNSYVDYVHYSLQLPNDDYTWNISGNYLLVIYEGRDEDALPIISRRFMVAEQAVDVAVTMKSPINAGKNRSHQEMDLQVNSRDLYIGDPLREITATVIQNGNWATKIEGLKPTFKSNGLINFRYNDKVVFPGLKEFRNFDIRHLQFASEYVHSIDLHDYGTDVLLKLQETRKYGFYHTRPDINGSFYISNDDSTVSETFRNDAVDGDYARVIFTLKSKGLNPFDSIYVVGGFNGWQLEDEYKLAFDTGRQIFTAEALFKQGYYDYMFAKVQDGKMDIVELEGSSYETNNEYQVLLYFRENGSRFDRLLAVKTFESNP